MEENEMYIYAIDRNSKKGKLIKSEVKFEKFVAFLDRLWDNNIHVQKSCRAEFEASRGGGKSTLTNDTYKLLYDKPF